MAKGVVEPIRTALTLAIHRAALPVKKAIPNIFCFPAEKPLASALRSFAHPTTTRYWIKIYTK